MSHKRRFQRLAQSPARPERAERGQSIIIVAVLLVAMMALLAVIFDGGFTYFQRRLAQTAADSGALAGARALCTGDGDPLEVAEDYAVNRNAADTADASLDEGLLTVETSITFDTFFASIVGFPEVDVVAGAEAGCFVPSGFTGHVMPIAWACEPPTTDLNPDNWTENECAVKYADPDTNSYPIYVLMDSVSASEDYYCQDPPNSGLPGGGLDCDVNNDGNNDIFAQGGRSWLDLDATSGGSNQLVNWINGTPVEISTHMWRAGQQGVSNNVFQAAASKTGWDMVMPVFDAFCSKAVDSGCPTPWHEGDNHPGGGGTSTVWYHIISFSIFHITCVDAPGAGTPLGGCPGANAARAAMAAAGYNNGQTNSLKAIEGYFVEGYIPGAEGENTDGPYTGGFTLYLTR